VSTICLVEDDPIMGESLADRFRLEGFAVTWLHDAETARAAILEDGFSLVICDIRLPGLAGDHLYEQLRDRLASLPPFLFITGYADLERAVHLLKLGASDYIAKPFDIERLLERVQEICRGRCRPADGAPALGVSAAMRRIEALLDRLGPLDDTVLITGETGVGKEVVARRLHEISRRGPFVPVNCAALAESLAEAELFGHEKGAFTGALRTHAGVFERASGGTLFLDEIGDMPLSLQAKLLRVLQDRAVVRVGGERPVAVDVRVVCATHQDLERKVAEGGFRPDLYYRVNVVTLHIPPLRERPEDIDWLAERFLDATARRRGGVRLRLSPDARRALTEAAWPGNVRELLHTLERTSIFVDGEVLTSAHLRGRVAEAPVPSTREAPTLDEYLGTCEREFIAQALADNGGRIEATARRLGISRKSLWERMRRLGLHGTD
jgi:DNA-binding NtrC family response regulator